MRSSSLALRNQQQYKNINLEGFQDCLSFYQMKRGERFCISNQFWVFLLIILFNQQIFIIYMTIQFREHYLTEDYHLQANNSSSRIVDILLYFALPYGILLVISFIFHTRSVQSQITFQIWPLPSQGSQKLIYYIVVVALGIIGVYVLIGNYWSASTWILYSVGCLLLAGYVFLYTLTNRFTLFLTSGIAVALAVVMQWLFIQTKSMTQNGISDQIIRNMVGGIGAWAIIYALLTLGQLFVSCGFNRKIQTILFFIVGIVGIALIAYWNRKEYAQWKDLIGFIGVGALLLIFSLFNVHSNSQKDIENLL